MIFSYLRSEKRSLKRMLSKSSLRYLKSTLFKFYLNLFSQINKNKFAFWMIFPHNFYRSSTTLASSALTSISFSSLFLNLWWGSPYRCSEFQTKRVRILLPCLSLRSSNINPLNSDLSFTKLFLVCTSYPLMYLWVLESDDNAAEV